MGALNHFSNHDFALNSSLATSLGHSLSIRLSTNSASRIGLSTKYSFAKFGLSDSIQSVSFRADKIVVANRMACLRSSVVANPAV
jgi:hypothetical protein